MIELKNKYHNLEVLLAIPSIHTERRRLIISKLEKIKVTVRTVPSFHELISDQKKMTDIQNLSIDDVTVVSDRSRFTDVTPTEALKETSTAKADEQVRIWSITMNKNSTGRFRAFFFFLTAL